MHIILFLELMGLIEILHNLQNILQNHKFTTSLQDADLIYEGEIIVSSESYDCN